MARILDHMDLLIIKNLAMHNNHVPTVADKMFMHPSSLHYRLRRIRDITGLDPYNFYDFAELMGYGAVREVNSVEDWPRN